MTGYFWPFVLILHVDIRDGQLVLVDGGGVSDSSSVGRSVVLNRNRNMEVMFPI
jgi:hypothetical protein